MKKVLILLSMMLIGLTGCTNNDELESLKKENETLKQVLNDSQNRQDISIEGDCTLTIYQICDDYGENEKLVIVSFYQKDPFLIRLDSEVATELNEGEDYTFEVDGKIDIKATSSEVIDFENILSKNSEKLKLVGPAKENEQGESSNRLSISQ